MSAIYRSLRHSYRTRLSILNLLIRALFAVVLTSASIAAVAQDDPKPPVDPNPNVPKEEPVDPVTMSASVSPTSIAAYTGTATLSWSSTNANSCEYDDTNRSVSGSVTVGPFNSSGTKSLTVTCTGTGEGNLAETAVDLTVTQAPVPTITTTLSSTLLEAGVDSLTVTWSTQYTDYCSSGGNNSYPTGGTANLGTYAAGSHSLSFSCTGDGGTTSHTISWEALNRPTVTPSASPATVKANGTSTASVSWNSPDADSCTYGGTSYGTSGSITFGPYAYSQAGSKSATVSCTNRLGTESGTASWTVEALAPTVTASLNPTTVLEDTGTSTLSWSSSNTDSCSRGGTAVSTSGSATVGSYATPGPYTFTVSCTGTGGTASDSATLTVEEEVIPDPPTVTVSLNPAKVLADSGTSTLSWSSTGATSCTRGGSTVATSGSVAVGPVSAGSQSYTVSCTGAGGSGSDSARLTAVSPPTVSVSADPTSVTAGEDTVELTWSSTNAMSCAYDGTTLTAGGTRTVGPFTAGSHTLTVSCEGLVSGASASDSVTISAIAAPTVAASLTPATVTAHVGETDLTWSSTGATSCSLNGGGSLQTSGSLTGLGPFYAGSYSYTVSCKNSLGFTNNRTVTVTAQGSSTALCSSETAAPANASSLSIGSHTFSVTGSTSGSIWGTGTYTADSDIATAAVHAGHVASGDTAIVTLTRAAGQSSYTGSTQNGVTSNSQASATGSYTLSLVGACRADPPNAPENLTATPNPSTDGDVELSWDAPSAGTTAAGYLVYRQDSTSGLLNKPFANRSLSISSLNTGSYTYKVYACSGTAEDPNCGPAANTTATVAVADTDGDGILDNLDTDDDNDGMPDACEKKYGFNPRDASDGGTTNTDGDGASNVHECLHGTDPTATPANTVLPDTDRDGMYDAWESNNRLDPNDADDASLDDDGDGHTNLEEFNARTDPQWDQSHPNSIPELQFGFNSSYTVQVGTINTGDMLKDILVRNPTSGILPSISDFVLIQKRDGGFDIEDADDYMITASALTDISSKATIVDINGDGVKDLVLTGLNTGTAAITGADDQIVYGSYYERYEVPEKHIALTATRKKFFADLSAWIDNASYFETNVPISTTLDIDEAENSDESQTRSAGSSGYLDFGETTITDTFFRNNLDKCVGLSPVYCYILASDGFWGRLDPFIVNQIRISAMGKKIIFAAPGGSSNHPTAVNVYDTSGFDQEARMLALYYLAPIRDSGSLAPGATNSKVISEMLETVFGVPVLKNRLLGIGNGALPKAEDHTSYTGTVREMIQSVKFQHDRLTLPAPQNQVTEEERQNSPNRDVTRGLPACGYLSACDVDDFLEEQIEAINTRLDELHDVLARVTYATSEDAAIAIHNSDLHQFAHQVGIEILVIIDDTSNPVRISGVYTDFNSDEVGLRRDSIGKDVWHNHPNLLAVWQGDAAGYVNAFGEAICRETDDFTVYASGTNLTRANVKQVIGIADTATYRFMYDELFQSSNTWYARTSPFSSEADEVEVTCP